MSAHATTDVAYGRADSLFMLGMAAKCHGPGIENACRCSQREIQMRRSTPNAEHPRKSALALPCEMQVAIGQQLRIECELPQKLLPKLTALLKRGDGEHDPYADVAIRTLARLRRQTIVVLGRRSFHRSIQFRVLVGAGLWRRRSPMPPCTVRSNVTDAR
jgi:hypothetical protein